MPVRKQQKLNDAQNTKDRVSSRTEKSNDVLQRRVSEGLCITKPRDKIPARSKISAAEASQPNSSHEAAIHPQSGNHQAGQSPHGVSRHLAHNIAVKRSLVTLIQDAERNTSSATSNEHHDESQPLNFDTNDCNTIELEKSGSPQVAAGDSIFDDEYFDDDLEDDELLELTSDVIDLGGGELVSPHPPLGSDAARTVHSDEQYPDSLGSAPIIVEEGNNVQQRAKKFVSPMTLTTRLLAATGDIDTAEARKPIVRPPFPVTVRDRSPIIGLSSNTLLRTCFRIGEVINQAHQAVRSGKHFIFELYARVLNSARDGAEQHFTLCDLFHGKPPYLKASYDAKIWGSVELFNYDSKRLLQQGRIGRYMGTMMREGKEWIMTVLNVWEATWEDIKWVEGVVNS
jgi:hypothetical protein